MALIRLIEQSKPSDVFLVFCARRTDVDRLMRSLERASLSIKALQDPPPERRPRRSSDPEFEQMLKRFMRQSEERLVDYKRAVEHKRK